MARVKGTAVHSSMRYVRESFGEAAFANILAALPEEDKVILGQEILASTWYPIASFLHFMQETERQLTKEEPDVLRKMGRASCDYGVTGVYRIFFRIGSPEFLVSRGVSVFARYYDTGTMRVAEARPGRTVVEVSSFEGGAPQFCERLYGWMYRSLELAGARNLRGSHSSCVHRGDAVCRFEGEWDH